MTYDALVLAGGTARRLGGVDKPGLLVAGIPLLDHVLRACAGAAARIVVGPERPSLLPALWVQEEVPFGGPVAGLAAGLTRVTADIVVVLAADLPFLDQGTVALLAAGGPQGVVLVAEGREQWLCSAWPTAQLRTALDGRPTRHAALHRVLAPLGPARCHVVGDSAPWTDVDTPADLARARAANAQRSVA